MANPTLFMQWKLLLNALRAQYSPTEIRRKIPLDFMRSWSKQLITKDVILQEEEPSLHLPKGTVVVMVRKIHCAQQLPVLLCT